MIFFVVPAYNEESNIDRLMDSVEFFMSSKYFAYHLIIVDDGSVDRTASIVQRRAIPNKHTLVSYKPNKGAAEAFRQGLHKALDKATDSDLIVTMEADCTSDLGILPALLAKIEEGADVALASCYAKGGKMLGNAWHRVFLSRCVNFFIGIVFSMRDIHTFSSFYRVYKPSALKAVLKNYGDFYDEKTFACVVELLIRLSTLKAKMAEVPMILQGANRIGKSKMRVTKTILGHLRMFSRNAAYIKRVK